MKKLTDAQWIFNQYFKNLIDINQYLTDTENQFYKDWLYQLNIA